MQEDRRPEADKEPRMTHLLSIMRIGTKIKPYGTLIAIGFVGERYYWFQDDNGAIAMIPAACLENKAPE